MRCGAPPPRCAQGDKRLPVLAEQATFVPPGLGETFLADLTKAVDAFDAANSVAHTNHLGHVGARADLEAVANECVKQAGIMDGLNRARFADNPEMLAAWISASKVEGRFRFKGVEPEPETVVAPVPVVSPVPAPSPVVTPEPVVVSAANRRSGAVTGDVGEAVVVA